MMREMTILSGVRSRKMPGTVQQEEGKEYINLEMCCLSRIFLSFHKQKGYVIERKVGGEKEDQSSNQLRAKKMVMILLLLPVL